MFKHTFPINRFIQLTKQNKNNYNKVNEINLLWVGIEANTEFGM